MPLRDSIAPAQQQVAAGASEALRCSVPLICLAIGPLHACGQRHAVVRGKGDAGGEQEQVAGFEVLVTVLAALVEAVSGGEREHHGVYGFIGS